MNKKVMVAMSGGVDSSVAALLLRNKGFEVIGVTMCLGVNYDTGNKARCCGPKEIEDARSVCTKLSIPHYVFDFSDQLEERVILPFIEEYRQARTPNPCVDCNRYLKFEGLFKRAKALGLDFLATGHYAGLGKYKGQIIVKKSKDKTKDQTYFLYAIKKECLGSILFPLSPYTKEQVRNLAKKANLPVADKQESQDICFIPGKDYRSFLLSRGIKPIAGDIVHINGKVLGKHKGIINYTIGQRSGLGISWPKPLYVINIDPKTNRVIIGQKEEIKAQGLIAKNLNIHVDKLPSLLTVKIRYAHPGIKSKISLEDKQIKVIFSKPQEAVTPGQAAVFYHKDALLGGGVIEQPIF